MPYLTWMADALRAGGLPVREIPGWQTRGHGAMSTVLGVLCHHTAGPASGAYPSERVVVNGRPGLDGPLANLGLDRNGTWVVVAAGVAWHAGTGSVAWCPANAGNAHLIGVEAESVGTRDDWTAAQRQNYPRGVAALLRHLNLPESRAIGHKEWARGRKIDPAFWDMAAFRAEVARHLRKDDELSQQQVDQIRRDIGWARDQIMTHLGKRPDMAPLPGAQLAGVEVARRVDVGWARDQTLAEFATVKHEIAELRELIEAIADRVGVPLTDAS